MLTESFRLTAGATHGTAGVSWTAPGDEWISWLFVNGRLAVEAFAPGTAERAIDVPLAAGALAVIEVQLTLRPTASAGSCPSGGPCA